MRSSLRFLIAALCALIIGTHAAFEDQYLKETWHRQYLGKPIAIATANKDTLTIFYTKENTIGAINNRIPFDSFSSATTVDNISWKHVLPVSEKSVAMSTDSKYIIALSSQVHNLTTTSHTALYPRSRISQSSVYNIRVFDVNGSLLWHKKEAFSSTPSMVIQQRKLVLYSTNSIRVIDIAGQSTVSDSSIQENMKIFSVIPTNTGISILGKTDSSVFRKNIPSERLSAQEPLDLTLSSEESQSIPPLSTRIFLKFPHSAPNSESQPVFLSFADGKVMYLPAHALGKSVWRSVELSEAMDVVPGATNSSPFSLLTSSEHSSDAVPVPFYITSSPSTGGLTFEPTLHTPCLSSASHLSLTSPLSISSSPVPATPASPPAFTLRLHLSPSAATVLGTSTLSATVMGADGGVIDCRVAGNIVFVTTAIRSVLAIPLPALTTTSTTAGVGAKDPLRVLWHRAEYLAAASAPYQGSHMPRFQHSHTLLQSDSGIPNSEFPGSSTGSGLASTSSVLFSLSRHALTAISPIDGSILWARYTASRTLMPLHSDTRRVPDVDDEVGAEAEAGEDADESVSDAVETGVTATSSNGRSNGQDETVPPFTPVPTLAVLEHKVCAAVPFRSGFRDSSLSTHCAATSGPVTDIEAALAAGIVTYIVCFDHTGADVPLPEKNNFPKFQNSGASSVAIPLPVLDMVSQAFPFANVIPGIVVADTVIKTPSSTLVDASHSGIWVLLSLNLSRSSSKTTQTSVVPQAWVLFSDSATASAADTATASAAALPAVSLSYITPERQLHSYTVHINSSTSTPAEATSRAGSVAAKSSVTAVTATAHLTLSRPIGGSTPSSAASASMVPFFPKITGNSHPNPVNSVRLVANNRLLKAASSQYAVIATEHCTTSSPSSSTTLTTVTPACVPHVLLTITNLASGAVIERMTIPSASRPLVALTEHRVICTYWDNRAMQHRVTVVELLRATTMVSWSGLLMQALGLAAPPAQLEGLYTLQQTYTLPTAPVAIATTSSSNGLANIDLIVASADGSLWEIPQVYLDARRPMTKEENADGNAEALPVYSTILPLTTNNLLSQNITLAGIHDVWVGPSDKESMSIVVVSGSDWYACSVYTSGKFDTLSDDFSRSFLFLTVVAVFVATLIAKYYADQQVIAREWK